MKVGIRRTTTPRENEILRLTDPTAISDGLHNPFQVKMLENPDSGTQDDPAKTVRERMHGGIYAPKNYAESIEKNGSEVDVITRQ